MPAIPAILDTLNCGIPVPEHQTVIPWLISERDLYRLIPKDQFEFSSGGWPMLRFTLRGVRELFGWNFVTDPEARFTEIQFSNSDVNSLNETFTSTSTLLRRHMGDPNRIDGRTQLLWDNDRVWIDNSIFPAGDCDEAPESLVHMLSVTLRPSCRSASLAK
jgi:hypothetical protein